MMNDALTIPQPRGRFSAINSALGVLRFIYVVSFAITLVNPAISGRTVYLYLLLPLLDIEFVAKMLQFKATRNRVVSFYAVMLLLMLSLHDLVFTIKYSLVIYQVVYLLFLSKKNLAHYLFITLIAHIIFALLQMGLFFFRPDMLQYVTPGYLASLIWGEGYATATFANFGFEFLLPRFSGLYRESAFFASYLMGLFLFFLTEKNFKYRTAAMVLIFIGILLSFSKISAALLIIIALNHFRKYLNKIPLSVSCLGYLVIFHFISLFAFDKIFNTYAYDSIGTNISIMHRLLSYYGLQHFDVWNLFFGAGDYTVMPTAVRGIVDTLYTEISGLTDASLFCGLAGILYKGGILGLTMFVLYLMYLGVKTSPFLILLFLTFSVTPDTLQSFVILGWYFVLKNTWFGSGFLELFHNNKQILPMPVPVRANVLI
jgi:hypothetical protein